LELAGLWRVHSLTNALLKLERPLADIKMADTRSLNVIGLMLGAAAMMVMMVGAFVVTDHVTGRMHLEEALPSLSAPTAAR
jgi:hypothetical protein